MHLKHSFELVQANELGDSMRTGWMPVNVGFCSGAFLSVEYWLSLVLHVSYSAYDPYPVKYVETPDRDTKGCHRGKCIKICEET